MNASTLLSKVNQAKKQNKPARFNVDKNLFIRISAELTPFWVFLFRQNKKQRQITIGRYGNKADELSLAEAREKVAELRKLHIDGFDPIVESKRERHRDIVLFDDLAQHWIDKECQKLKNPQIPIRIYNKEIKKHIGNMRIDKVSGIDVTDILEEIMASKRPSIANDALLHLKQIFAHGIRLGVTNSNPASAFSNKQAGGTENSRNRHLNLEEIKKAFSVFRQYSTHFTTENYIAVVILLVTGVRKTELTQAPWNEFNIETFERDGGLIWKLPKERAKNGIPIVIPVADRLIPYFKLLKALSFGSKYVFPTRRAGKKGHISDDTLNHALTNLFGKKTGKLESSTGNVLGQAGIEYFQIHDLRRTCRTLLSSLEVNDNVAEKCLNHKIKGVSGIYNQYQYFDERKIALNKLAELVFPLIDNPKINPPS